VFYPLDLEIHRPAPPATRLGNELGGDRERSEADPCPGFGMIDPRARDLDKSFPAAPRLGLHHRICSRTRQGDLGFGAVDLPEHHVFRQRKRKLDQLALVFSGDLTNFDAVEKELPGLWRVQRQPSILDGRQQNFAVAPDFVNIRTDPFALSGQASRLTISIAALIECLRTRGNSLRERTASLKIGLLWHAISHGVASCSDRACRGSLPAATEISTI